MISFRNDELLRVDGDEDQFRLELVQPLRLPQSAHRHRSPGRRSCFLELTSVSPVIVKFLFSICNPLIIVMFLDIIVDFFVIILLIITK